MPSYTREQSRHREGGKSDCQVFRVDEACSQKQSKQETKGFVRVDHCSSPEQFQRVHLQNSRKNREGTPQEKQTTHRKTFMTFLE